jgi:hypothetical protein
MRFNAVAQQLMEALALLLTDSEDQLKETTFHDHLDAGEFASALEELAAVVRRSTRS